MLDQIRAHFETHKDREAFFAIVSQHFPLGSSDYFLIEKAYNTAKEAFRGMNREGAGKKRYFEHLRCVALILMVHLRVTDARLIAAALLHDIIEDIKEWPFERVAREFGQEVAELVWWVTKPPVEEHNGSKQLRNNFYHERLRKAPRKALLIKLCDRLHNMLDMWGVSEEKQQRKVSETFDFYLPLATKEIVLIHELETVLKELSNGWTTA